MSQRNRTRTDSNRTDLDRLIVEHQPRLKSFIRKRVTNKEDADDILQDVFYQFITYMDGAVSPIYELSAWLNRVAQNVIINKSKKKKEDSLPDFQDTEYEESLFKDFSDILFGTEEASPSPEIEYLRSLVWIELESALEELPAEQREVFEQTELEGLSVKEIAAALGVSVNTVLSRKRYAVLHLRKRLAELYNDLIEQ